MEQQLELLLPQEEVEEVEERAPPGRPRGQQLNAKARAMCEYHLAGMTHVEIAREMGMHEVSVGVRLRSPLAQEYLRDRVEDLNLEFHGMYRHVLNTFGEAFTTGDIDTKLLATDKWLKAQGRYAPKAQKDATPTAEDIIAKILERKHNGTLVVNVDNRTLNVNAGDAGNGE